MFRTVSVKVPTYLFATSLTCIGRLNPCDIIETKFGLQHARFVAWNPSVNVNCTNLRYGYGYCVSIPNYKPTYTSKIYTYATIPLQIPSLDISDDLAPPTARIISVVTSGSSVSVEPKATSKTNDGVKSSVKNTALGSSWKGAVATGIVIKKLYDEDRHQS
jgi:hypothetical protein